MSIVVSNPNQLPGLIKARMRGIERRVKKALEKTAVEAVPMIRKRTPKAFGDLQGSIHAETLAEGARTVVDAPHAGAVEIGSPPHMPNMDRLLAWVKLRGAQGLTERGRLRTRYPRMALGLTTPRQARRVAKALKALEVRAARANKRKKRDAYGRYLPTDAAVQVAKAIADAIQKRGTRPYWYVRSSLTEIAATMGRRVRSAVKQ